jgi:hypothetical protein
MVNFYEDIEVKNIAWQSTIKYSDISSMSEEERSLFINALGSAVQKVCWDYGLHN